MSTGTAQIVDTSAGVRAGIPEGNVAELFFQAIDRYAKPDALKVKKAGAWHNISHRDVDRYVRHLSAALRSFDLTRGDRVAILSENRPEWLLSDFACVMAELVSVPLYPMLPAEQIRYMLEDSEAKLVFVSDAEQLAKVQGLRQHIRTIERIVMYGTPPPDATDDAVLALDDVLRTGASAAASTDPERYRESALAIDPHDVLTILYTSGTTGRPKGVVLTHNNLVSNVRGSLRLLDLGSEDSSLSFLPLSHIFERMAGHYVMFAAGATICYAESFETVAEDLRQVRPTVMTTVPRGVEKIHERARETAREGGAAKVRILDWAFDVARRWADRRLAGENPGIPLRLQRFVADRLAYSKLRAGIGGRMRYLVSGGAPLNPELTRLFYGAGIEILEGYGLTETSPVITVNTPESFRLGSVGRPIPDVEVAIDAEREILTRGPHVMKGYYRMPDVTAEAIEPDGWFHTGDIGHLDEDGYLFITDRKKQLLKTSGGKYIAPQPIEERVRDNRFVAYAIVIGDGRKFPALLVAPDFDALESWAREEGIDFGTREELVRDERTVEFLESELLDPLDDLARFERPKKLVLVPDRFSVDSGELTPTLKVKRRVIDQKYSDLIESIYAD